MEDKWERLHAAQRMQDYIHQQLALDEDIVLNDLCKVANYSKWHSVRIFKEVFDKTPFEYVRALRLTNAARYLRAGKNAGILQAAVAAGFDSHEGFTKAFSRHFGVNPGKYRQHLPRRYMYFDPPPILRYHLLQQSKEYEAMSQTPRTVTVTVVEKSPRKLILKRGVTATDYWSYCEEMGCDVWEELAAIPSLLEGPSLCSLPPHMIPTGTSMVACAIEVPADFSGVVPHGCEIIDLPPHLYLWFQGAPYEDESWFGSAHEELDKAIANYRPEQYGYVYARDKAPVFIHGSSAAGGTKKLIPVRKLPTN